jgi:hypothetical protein
MQDVMARTPKVIDLSSGKNILSLPTDGRSAPVPATTTVVGSESTKGGR